MQSESYYRIRFPVEIPGSVEPCIKEIRYPDLAAARADRVLLERLRDSYLLPWNVCGYDWASEDLKAMGREARWGERTAEDEQEVTRLTVLYDAWMTDYLKRMGNDRVLSVADFRIERVIVEFAE